jgi:tetratricopeptide (TPR) repeat protein
LYNAEAYLERGKAYYFKDEYDRAIADFNRAVKLNPENAQAYAFRGMTYKAKGEIEQARADLERAIELEPDDEYYQKWYADAKKQSGCFITTAVCGSFGKPDDCRELTAFRAFRDNWLAKQPDGKALVAEYYHIAPRIVAAIDAAPDSAGIYRGIWDAYLADCLRLIDSGRFAECRDVYVRMVNDLKAERLTIVRDGKGEEI